MSANAPLIDVHCHLTPQCFQRAVLGGELWHNMSPADGELDNLKNRWLPERRLEEMEELGIEMQLVSSTDVFYQYEQEPSVTAAIARDCNDELAELVRAHPTRFMGIGTAPMQAPELAIAELQRAVNELGLKGLMINDHVNGLTYDHERFRDFWAAARRARRVLPDSPVPPDHRHLPHRELLPLQLGREPRWTGRSPSARSCTAGSSTTSRTIRFCLAHAGGYVPYALDRMDKGWEKFPDSRGRTQGPPSTYTDRFYYDTVIFKDTHLRFLVDTVGIERMVFGTDWPAPMDVDDGAADRAHAGAERPRAGGDPPREQREDLRLGPAVEPESIRYSTRASSDVAASIRAAASSCAGCSLNASSCSTPSKCASTIQS